MAGMKRLWIHQTRTDASTYAILVFILVVILVIIVAQSSALLGNCEGRGKHDMLGYEIISIQRTFLPGEKTRKLPRSSTPVITHRGVECGMLMVKW